MVDDQTDEWINVSENAGAVGTKDLDWTAAENRVELHDGTPNEGGTTGRTLPEDED